MMRGWILAAVALVVFATRVAAFTTCAQSTFQFDCSSCPGTTSTTPTGMVKPIFCTVDPWQAGEPCPNACYDLPHGRVEAHQAAQAVVRCDNSISARDTLQLGGKDGPAVSFEAVLLVRCTISNGGSGTAMLMGQHRTYSASTSEEFVVPLSAVPGSAFEISFGVSASNASPCCVSGSGVADITADLRFRGLPAENWLVPCPGGLTPVPASVASWGSVKALYR